MTLSTSSKNLAKQYSEMISRLGIVGHVYKLDRKDITRHPNTEYKITVRNEKYNKNLIKFKKYIDLTEINKKTRLEYVIGTI